MKFKERQVVYFGDKRRLKELLRCLIFNKHEWEEVMAPRAHEYRCLHCGRKRI